MARRLTRWTSVPTAQIEPAGLSVTCLMMYSVEPESSALKLVVSAGPVDHWVMWSVPAGEAYPVCVQPPDETVGVVVEPRRSKGIDC